MPCLPPLGILCLPILSYNCIVLSLGLRLIVNDDVSSNETRLSAALWPASWNALAHIEQRCELLSWMGVVDSLLVDQNNSLSHLPLTINHERRQYTYRMT